MEKEFVAYEQALDLKELGFDEPCFGYYDNQIKELDTISSEVCERLCKHDIHIKAPTYSQAFRWFREKYQIFPEVLTDCTTEPKFVYTYNTFYGNPKDLTEKEWGWENNIGQYSDLYRTYEESELVCLKKLIEIVKNK